MSSDLSEAWVEEVPEPVAQEIESDPDRTRGIMQDFANAWYPVYAPYQVYHPILAQSIQNCHLYCSEKSSIE